MYTVSVNTMIMDNDQNFDNTTTEEDADDENVLCAPGRLPQGCYYKSCAYGSSSRQECYKYISVRRVTMDAGYVMTVTKRVPIMDIIMD